MVGMMQIFSYIASSMGAGLLGTFGVCGRSCYWTTRATLALYRCMNLACGNSPFTPVFYLVRKKQSVQNIFFGLPVWFCCLIPASALLASLLSCEIPCQSESVCT
jgi:hypothetical protein